MHKIRGNAIHELFTFHSTMLVKNRGSWSKSSHCLNSKELHVRVAVFGEHGQNRKHLVRHNRPVQVGA